MPQVGIACLWHRVVVDVDRVVEHSHRGSRGASQMLQIQRAAVALPSHVCNEVHRAEIAHRNLVVAGVQRDLSTEIRRMNHPRVPLRRPDIAWILERNPRMAGFVQHREHLSHNEIFDCKSAKALVSVSPPL